MEPEQMEIDIPSTSQGQGTKKRFEVKKWSAVCMWSWDIAVDNCAICRNHIMELCIGCQANTANQTTTKEGDECTVAWGYMKDAYLRPCPWTGSKKKKPRPLSDSTPRTPKETTRWPKPLYSYRNGRLKERSRPAKDPTLILSGT
ncbi:RBX1 [Cordylochernes scorpioides]|uniref:RBX1 n=1 Tax=Cordylochernes scorpioides TaxID=51811 RepID=A0ABY6LES4_9ARAC|nr:RBX1 [Cordylochernes scorpioides]